MCLVLFYRNGNSFFAAIPNLTLDFTVFPDAHEEPNFLSVKKRLQKFHIAKYKIILYQLRNSQLLNSCHGFKYIMLCDDMDNFMLISNHYCRIFFINH